LALLVYKALHDATAAYHVDDSLSAGHTGYNRPTSTRVVSHGPTHGSATGAAGPRLWNSLPARIRQPDNDTGEFRRQLKSFLFK